MASFTLSQQKDTVAYVGHSKYHDVRGHNSLTADISGTDLSHAWVELSLNGGSWESMKEWTKSDLLYPVNNAPDGTAIGSISIREALSIRYPTTDQNKLVMIWGADGSPGTELWWAESTTADPTSFSNSQKVLDAANDTGGNQAEDPNWYYDEDAGKLRVQYETSAATDGYVSIWDADTTEGKSYSNERVIGSDQWDLGIKFASPSVWRYNNDFFIGGEEHSSGYGDRSLMIAKGSLYPDKFEEFIISANSSDHSVTGHINVQAQHMDRYGTFHIYSNQEVSSGTWACRHMETSTFEDNYPVEPWTLSTDTTNHVLGCILRPWNDMYVYGNDPSTKTEVYYWNVPGTVIQKSIASSGGTASWEFLEPLAPPGATVEWRVAVEDTGGVVERSASSSFTIGSAPGVGDAGNVDTTASIPSTSQSAAIVVREDTNADGAWDNYETVEIDNGTNSYQISGFDWSAGNDIWPEGHLETTDKTTTPTIDSISIESAVTTATASGQVASASGGGATAVTTATGTATGQNESSRGLGSDVLTITTAEAGGGAVSEFGLGTSTSTTTVAEATGNLAAEFGSGASASTATVAEATAGLASVFGPGASVTATAVSEASGSNAAAFGLGAISGVTVGVAGGALTASSGLGGATTTSAASNASGQAAATFPLGATASTMAIASASGGAAAAFGLGSTSSTHVVLASANLSGSTDLVATATQRITGASVLTGSGTLSSGATTVTAASAALAGSANLTATGSVITGSRLIRRIERTLKWSVTEAATIEWKDTNERTLTPDE